MLVLAGRAQNGLVKKVYKKKTIDGGDDELVVNPPTPCKLQAPASTETKIRPASKGRTVEGTNKIIKIEN